MPSGLAVFMFSCLDFGDFLWCFRGVCDDSVAFQWCVCDVCDVCVNAELLWICTRLHHGQRSGTGQYFSGCSGGYFFGIFFFFCVIFHVPASQGVAGIPSPTFLSWTCPARPLTSPVFSLTPVSTPYILLAVYWFIIDDLYTANHTLACLACSLLKVNDSTATALSHSVLPWTHSLAKHSKSTEGHEQGRKLQGNAWWIDATSQIFKAQETVESFL